MKWSMISASVLALLLVSFAVVSSAETEQIYIKVEICEGNCDELGTPIATQTLILVEGVTSSGTYYSDSNQRQMTSNLTSSESPSREIVYHFTVREVDGNLVLMGNVKSISYEWGGRITGGKRVSINAPFEIGAQGQLFLPWVTEELSFWYRVTDSRK